MKRKKKGKKHEMKINRKNKKKINSEKKINRKTEKKRKRGQKELIRRSDKQKSGCEDHKCAHMCRRVGGMMTDVHVAILSMPLHICENLVQFRSAPAVQAMVWIGVRASLFETECWLEHDQV